MAVARASRAEQGAPFAPGSAGPADSTSMDNLGRVLLWALLGGVVVLGGLAWLLAALTPAGFGAALLALGVGIPSFMLGGVSVPQLLKRRQKRHEPDGQEVKLPRERGAISNALLALGLSVVGVGAAVALIGQLAFGVGLLYALAGVVTLLVAYLLFWGVVRLIWKIGDRVRQP